MLRPNAGIEADYVAAILPLIRRMCDETRAVIERNWRPAATDSAMDAGNMSFEMRVQIANLLAKYEPMFRKVAKRATKRMIDRTLKYSSVAIGQSLKDVAKQWTLNPAYLATPRMQEVITAATTEAANLIRLIPAKYLGDVQGQVMRSITTGQGLKDLVPYLTEKYKGNVRHARLVAIDQTRKAFATVNATRLQEIGVEEFKWMHVGGSQEPRKNHVAMNGKVYRYDDPPIVGVMYGQEVRGLPSTLPNCRCLARPILKFK